MQITSTKNPLLQQIRRAASAGRALEDGYIVLEGPHLLEELARSDWTVSTVLASAGAIDRNAAVLAEFKDKFLSNDARKTGTASGAPRKERRVSLPDSGRASASFALLEVSERALISAAPTEAPQGVLALARPPRWEWGDMAGSGVGLIVILDQVQDPGNAGTIVRSAEAFGATGVVFTRGSVRVANPKFLRATAGSILRTPFIEGVGAADIFAALDGVRIYALTPGGERDLESCDFSARCAIVVGSEGAGISSEFLSRAEPVRIPAVKVESLNAAVACSIALFEAARQRRTG